MSFINLRSEDQSRIASESADAAPKLYILRGAILVAPVEHGISGSGDNGCCHFFWHKTIAIYGRQKRLDSMSSTKSEVG